MGLPVIFATNRDQSKLDDNIPQTPSYFKHLKSLKPDTNLLVTWLKGLVQSFPNFSPEELMRCYIEQVPGISGKLSDEECQSIIEQAVSEVSIQSEVPPMKLLTSQ